ncbi:hypothetical protein ACFOW1_15270 [Parasediminibacterium paludis]|uniref:Secreted protein n=1 Tax=Parasediminibacterium paludis TaxID=908966 RepID=A0ABV8Q2U6_9BACT
MFKQSIAILFLMAFMAQTFSKAVIICSFYANQSYIAKNLCENRTKPKSCCAGKCQLKKKLNKDTNEDKQNTERKSSKETEVISSKSFFCAYQQLSALTFKQAYCISSNSNTVNRTYPIFHPPGCC